MKISSADMARMFGDPDEDYDSFEKCVVRSIDALDALTLFLDGFIEWAEENADDEFLKSVKTQKAVALSLRNTLREWGLGNGLPKAARHG